MLSLEPDLNELLRKMRLGVAEYLDYGDCNMLLYDDQTQNYMALSPNTEIEKLPDIGRLNMYFYNPGECLSMKFLASAKKSWSLHNAREQPEFLEGVDNLTPVLYSYSESQP